RHIGPDFVDEARDGVFLEPEIRQVEGVDHVLGGDQEAHLHAGRNVQRLVNIQHVVEIFFRCVLAIVLGSGTVGEQASLQYRSVELFRRRLQVGEEEYANVVVVLVGQVFVAPLPAIAGDLDGQLGSAGVIHADQYAGGRYSHADQDNEGNHRPDHFQEHVLVEIRRLRALAATVGDHGVHDQAEHQQADVGTDPQDQGVQLINFLADRGNPGTQVLFGPDGPVTGDGHPADDQQAERGH